jgi:hypothetical protein
MAGHSLCRRPLEPVIESQAEFVIRKAASIQTLHGCGIQAAECGKKAGGGLGE